METLKKERRSGNIDSNKEKFVTIQIEGKQSQKRELERRKNLDVIIRQTMKTAPVICAIIKYNYQKNDAKS